MQPRPWRETSGPGFRARSFPCAGGSSPRAAGAGRVGARATLGAARPAAARQPPRRADVGGDGLGPDEDGAAALRRHDAVELGPVLVASPRPPGRPTGGLGHVQPEVGAVVGPDEAHRARDGGPLQAGLNASVARPDARSRASLRASPPATTAATPGDPSTGSAMTPALTTEAWTSRPGGRRRRRRGDGRPRPAVDVSRSACPILSRRRRRRAELSRPAPGPVTTGGPVSAGGPPRPPRRSRPAPRAAARTRRSRCRRPT